MPDRQPPPPLRHTYPPHTAMIAHTRLSATTHRPLPPPSRSAIQHQKILELLPVYFPGE
jgi:hypothetical protein